MTRLEDLVKAMLENIRSTHNFLIEKYGGEVIKESWNQYGCEWIVRVDGSLFQFVWEIRDYPYLWGINVMLGCPDAQSRLNEWWNWVTILEFIAYVWNLPKPSLTEIRKTEWIEQIILFIRHPNYYQKWCKEFNDWYDKYYKSKVK